MEMEIISEYDTEQQHSRKVPDYCHCNKLRLKNVTRGVKSEKTYETTKALSKPNNIDTFSSGVNFPQAKLVFQSWLMYARLCAILVHTETLSCNISHKDIKHKQCPLDELRSDVSPTEMTCVIRKLNAVAVSLSLYLSIHNKKKHLKLTKQRKSTTRES